MGLSSQLMLMTKVGKTTLDELKSVWNNRHFAGLALTTGIAGVAFSLHALSSLRVVSPLMLAMLLGLLVRNTVGVASVCQSGIQFSLKRLLRVAIALLGLQLSFSQLWTVGPGGLGIVTVTLVSTFAFTTWVGQQLGVPGKLTRLIAVGTSICGASAVIAANVVVEDSEENAAYAVGMVTVFGTASMLLYPLLPELLSLTPQAFGLWCGASIHEVAQVVAASFQHGAVSGQIGTVAKLSRVIFLAPVVLCLGWQWIPVSPRLGQNQAQAAIPWFVVAFIGFAGINSLNLIPELIRQLVIQGNQLLLVIALAAMGLETHLGKLKRVGVKPFYLAGLSSLFITVVSLGLVQLFYAQ